MAYIIRPDRWQQTPDGALEIDWNHPLAQGLLAAVPLNTPAPVELVSRQPPLVASGTRAFKAGPRGAGWYFATGELRWLLAKSADLPLTLLGLYTIDPTSAVFNNVGARDTFMALSTNGSPYESAAISYLNNAGGSAVASGLLMDNQDGSANFGVGSTNLWSGYAGRELMIGCAFASTTSYRVFLDGRVDGAETQTAEAAGPLTHLSAGCGYASPSVGFYAKGLVRGLLAYNRVIADGEARAYYENPWQMYRRALSRGYFFGSAGASFAAWRARRAAVINRGH